MHWASNTKIEMGAAAEGQSAERAAALSSREESRGATGEAIGCISSDRSAVKL